MKKTVFLVFVVLLSIGTASAENIITAQYPDKILFEGIEYDLNSNPLEAFFEKFPEKKPRGGMSSTALWRGYVAYFEIIDKQLFVTDIMIQVPDETPGKRSKWISAFDQVFPAQEKVKIDWFTGILILPHGKLINYVHMGYASTYSKYWLLEIAGGDFKEARKYRNKDFLQFKQRQFAEFEKTEEYKKLYAELKEGDGAGDENFLKSFIANFVINYTSKFLTE